jgi:hypothetical protein
MCFAIYVMLDLVLHSRVYCVPITAQGLWQYAFEISPFDLPVVICLPNVRSAFYYVQMLKES